MEAELLRDMIADREQRIATVKRKTDQLNEKEIRMSKELEEVGQQNMESQIHLQTEKTRLLHSRQTSLQQLEAMQRDLRQQGSSLQAYAGAVRQEQIGDSGFVMRMQAQLCKAMHSLGIVDHQLELAKNHSEELIKMQKDALAAMEEEKTRTELQLMNELMKTDTERRNIESDFNARLGEIKKDMNAVEDQLENSDEEDETEEDDEEEEDEEEKEAKEELMKMLQERKEEIQRLERLTAQQVETIQELEDELGDEEGKAKSTEISLGQEERHLNGKTRPEPDKTLGDDGADPSEEHADESEDDDDEEEGDSDDEDAQPEND